MKTLFLVSVLAISLQAAASPMRAVPAWHCSNPAARESFWVENTGRPTAFAWDEYARELAHLSVDASDDDRVVYWNEKLALTIHVVAPPSRECPGRLVAEFARREAITKTAIFCCSPEVLR